MVPWKGGAVSHSPTITFPDFSILWVPSCDSLTSDSIEKTLLRVMLFSTITSYEHMNVLVEDTKLTVGEFK